MRVARMTLFVVITAALSIGAVAPAHAQRAYLGGAYMTGSFPVGDWGEIAGFGLGVDATNVTYPSPEKPFAIRSAAGLNYNFSRSVGVPAANLAPTSKLDLETKNTSFYFGIGPEFSRKKGDVVPFLFGTAGFETYWTQSTLSGTAGGAPYSSDHGDSRIAFAWSAGLGIRKHVTDGSVVEISAEYRSGLTHKFLLPGEVTESGGAVAVNRDSHASDQILVRIGTLLGY